MDKLFSRNGLIIMVCCILAMLAALFIGIVTGGFGRLIHGVKSEAAGQNIDVTIDIDAGSVENAAKNVNGLTYKGFGVLSANSTSNLLLDYKYQDPKAYKELLQVLFGGEHPLMTHVKMEMGNDGNNSTGADACTMRYEDEEADASRSPGFVLAADAKKVNPNVKVSILRWEMPAWVQRYWNSDKTGKGYEAMYKWYKETDLDCYEKYGYLFDYINPDKNETGTPDDDFIKWFRRKIDNDDDFPEYMDDAAIKAYHNTKIIASDEYISLNIVPDMRKDEELYNAVDAIGFHYSTGTSTSTKDYVAMADVDDKEIWYSEGCGSFSFSEYHGNKTTAYGAGTIGGYQSPLAMCDCMVKSAVYSRKTHYIFQPAIGSFYEGSQYDHKELLSAREPWSGNIHYDEAIYCLQHFTKFAKTGWENADNTAGIWRYIPDASDNNSDGTEHLTNEKGNPSYMTLASPDKKDFSTIVVNNSDKTLTYKIDIFGMDIADGTKLERYTTKTGSYMQYSGDVADDGNGYIFEVEPFSIVTVTTLKCNGKEEYSARLPEDKEGVVLDTGVTGSGMDTTDNEILYADDFSYGDYADDYLKQRGNEPRYLVDYSGAFVVEDGRLKQELGEKISQWQDNNPNAVLGDHRWMNYKAEVDVELPDGGFAGIAIREQTGLAYNGSGYSLRIDDNGTWTFAKRNSTIASGSVDKKSEGSYRLSLTGQGNKITASIDGTVLKEYEDSNAEYFGRIRLFSGWNQAYYDNLVVSKLSGDMDITTIPYGKALIDNADDAVEYDGSWATDIGGGSANDWYRSTSKSSSAGASFSFKMKGDGFALIGKNSSGEVDIICDGKTVRENEKFMQSEQHGAFVMADGLGEAEHDIKVVLKTGSITLDAIMPIGAIPEIVKKYQIPTAADFDFGNNSQGNNGDNGQDNGSNGGDNGQNSGTDNGQNNQNAGQNGNGSGSTMQGGQAAGTQPVTVQPGAVTTGSGDTPDNNGSADKNAPAKVKIKSAKRSKGKVIITWKKLKDAKGYIIERSDGNKKKFKKIAAIKKNKTVKYTDKKAPKKVCYYRMRAYKSVDGKKVYGKYSAVVKVKK